MRKQVPMIMFAAAWGLLGNVCVQAQDLPSVPMVESMATVEPIPTGQPTVRPMPTIQAEEIHGGGNWADAPDTMASSVGQHWNIDGLRFSSNQVSGRIAISGSDIIDSANVEGQLSGRGVTGKLRDDEGKELAEFGGTLTSTGAFGTYRDRTGREGQWQWDGQPAPVQFQP